MPGPTPKPSRLRQRKNKVSTAASLPSAAEAAEYEVPELPDRADGDDWRPQAIEFWEDIWRSPMAAEFVDSDFHGILDLTDLAHRRYAPDVSDSMALSIAKELRLGRQQYGGDPIARRRLQWEVARGEDAEKKRRTGRAPKRTEADGDDPRSILKVS